VGELKLPEAAGHSAWCLVAMNGLVPACSPFNLFASSSLMQPQVCHLVSLVSLWMVYAQSSFLFYDSFQVGVCPSIYILVLRVAMVGIYIVGGWAICI
jgi:hypothetical protein